MSSYCVGEYAVETVLRTQRLEIARTAIYPMILTVVSSFILMKRRIMMEGLPHRLRDFWKKWELRVLVFVSLASQIILIILGNRRKSIPKIWIKCVVWCAYLLADAVATMGLGVLLNNLGEIYDEGSSPDANNDLAAFWAPFFLLHLGGPDTITAYSLEDNQLYLRHAFGLLVQTFSAILIIFFAWSGSLLSFLAMAIILVGLIKYGERTWTLWLASSEQLRGSMLTPPDAGPNYPKFMDEYSLKHAEGFFVEAEEVKDVHVEIDVSAPKASTSEVNMVKAHALFQTFKCLFADLILSFQDRDTSQTLFQTMSQEDAFNVIAIELEFMYDLLYTKAAVIYTPWGLARRIFTTFVTCIVLAIFSFADKRKYHKIDYSITFLLLIVGILLEVYAAFSLLLSDQSSLWFIKHRKTTMLKAFKFLEPVIKLPRWSNSMGQYSLTCLCLEDKPGLKVLRLLCVKKLRETMNELCEMYEYRSFKKVPECLRKLIFKHVKKISDEFEKIREKDNNSGKDIYTNRGIRALEKYEHRALDWSIKVEFDQSILIWHIATEICYYSATQDNNSVDTNRKMSKLLSRYMLYLLVLYPSLLPVGIGLIRFRDTRSEANKFFEERMSNFSTIRTHSSEACDQRRERRIQACTMLLGVKTYVPPVKVKGDRSKSVLFDACRLASALNGIVDAKRRWKMVRDVWLEMLTYAASQGRGSQHAHQLRRGGELLTHVWLLMAHFGLTDQFQISQGHARAKLIVK